MTVLNGVFVTVLPYQEKRARYPTCSPVEEVEEVDHNNEYASDFEAQSPKDHGGERIVRFVPKDSEEDEARILVESHEVKILLAS